MGDLQAHVMLHPIRMRVVLALASDELTTKQIHGRLPDVAQASLYRAISRLVDAGIITVVDRRKRGGAVERVYRVVEAPGTLEAGAAPSEIVAAADALAGALSMDAARWASAPGAKVEVTLKREVIRLSVEQARSLARDMSRLVDRALADGGDGQTTAITWAVLPGLEPGDDAADQS